MKNRLFTVMMVLLLMFNMTGYSIFSLLGTADRSELANVSSGDFVVIKIPANLPPYLAEASINETVDKEIIHENNYFQVLDQHIANDTLYLHCEFNQNARERFWNLVNSLDLDSEKQSQIPAFLFKNILKEYISLQKRHYFFLFDWPSPSVAFDFLELSSVNPFRAVASPPPIDRIC